MSDPEISPDPIHPPPDSLPALQQSSPNGTPAAPPKDYPNERDEIYFASPATGQSIDEVLIEDRIRRRWLLPLCLFLATCCTTFLAGVYQWRQDLFPLDQNTAVWVARNWQNGLLYMVAVLAFLAAHEMGHFLMTVRYRVHSSYPIVIPLPFYIGTMGAVIAMDGRRADRRQMFDIGIAGPLAGLVVAVPVLCMGVMQATLVVPPPGAIVSGDPLLAELLIQWLRPDAVAGSEVLLMGNPLYMAGWVGMLVTGLNMMPISQLDGGHIIYALFRKRSHYLARAFLLSAIAYVVLSDNYRWTLMIIIVTFLGADHPPTSNDNIPLGRVRYALGVASLLIPVFCFIPNPF
jgi:membrane-associated protease RseP (regulator of RpoE activity)